MASAHGNQKAAGPEERLSSIAELLAASGPANEKLGQLTPDVVDALHSQRMFRLLIPKAYGGDEIDLPTLFRTMEALGRLDASTAWCIGQMNACAAAAAACFPTETAREIWSDPRAAVTWGPGTTVRALETDGGYKVGGNATMASGSRHATWVGVWSPIFDRNGAPKPELPGAYQRVFMMPVSAVEFVDDWAPLGLGATNSGSFKIAERFVPKALALQRDYVDEGHIPGLLYQFPTHTMFALSFSAIALGLARALLDPAIALASKKNPRLSVLTLRDNHVVQFTIGEAEARWRSARNYVERTVEDVWKAASITGKPTIAQRMDVRMAATFAIHEAKAVAHAAWEVAGTTAVFRGGPYERRMRDLTTLTQHLQGRKSHLQEVGAWLLGFEPNLAMA